MKDVSNPVRVCKPSHFKSININEIVQNSKKTLEYEDVKIFDTDKTTVIIGVKDNVVTQVIQREENAVITWFFDALSVYYREANSDYSVEYPLSTLHFESLKENLPELVFSDGIPVYDVFNNVLELS